MPRQRKSTIEVQGDDFEAPLLVVTVNDKAVKHGPCCRSGCTQVGNKWSGDFAFLCTSHRKDDGWLTVKGGGA